MAKAKEEITLGCDPELILSKDGQHASARDYFSSQDAFGCDGNNDVAELRPGISTDPIDLTAKIGALLQYGYEQFPALKMHGGAFQFDYPIGGHIHLGGVRESPILTRNLCFTIENLQNYLFPIAETFRRTATGYGSSCEIRQQSYGIEYRTPHSWLVSPLCTLGYLTLALLCAYNQETIFEALDGVDDPIEFMRTLNTRTDINIPECCKEALDYLPDLIEQKLDNLNEDLLVNWEIRV